MKKVVNLTLHEENTSVSFRRQRNSNSAEKKKLKVTIYQSRNPTVERDYVGGGGRVGRVLVKSLITGSVDS
jgi:hypothetical protein